MREMRKKVMRWLVAIGFAASLGLLVAACGSSDSGDSGSGESGSSGAPTPVKIGSTVWIGYGPLWILDQKGFDKDNGVDVKLTNFAEDKELETAFAAGKFDAFTIGNNNQIRMAAEGIPFSVALMEDFSLTADAIVSCNPKIRSINDLAGAKVAFEELSVDDLLFQYALKQAGLTIDDVDYTPMPADAAGAAAVSGRVDVAATYQPYLQAALREGDNCKIIYSAKERPGLISDALSFNPDFIKSNGDAAAGVLKAWDQAVDFYNTNTEEAQAIVAKAVGETPKALKPSFDGIRLFGLQESQDFLENDFPGLWNDIGKIMVDQGQIKEVPDVNEFLDTDVGKQALESQSDGGGE